MKAYRWFAFSIAERNYSLSASAIKHWSLRNIPRAMQVKRLRTINYSGTLRNIVTHFRRLRDYKEKTQETSNFFLDAILSAFNTCKVQITRKSFACFFSRTTEIFFFISQFVRIKAAPKRHGQCMSMHIRRITVYIYIMCVIYIC